MTGGNVQTIQSDAAARGGSMVWLVSDADPEYPGQFTGRPDTLDHHGGKRLPDVFVADTLVELQAQVPTGLTITPRMPWQNFYPDGVLESWD